MYEEIEIAVGSKYPSTIDSYDARSCIGDEGDGYTNTLTTPQSTLPSITFYQHNNHDIN